MISKINTSIMGYPMPNEPKETEFEITAYIKASDYFPDSWDKEMKEEYIKENLAEYLDTDYLEEYEIEL